MTDQMVTRDTLRRELLLNAARKPLAVSVGLGVLVAGLVLGTTLLIPVALVFYLALAASTFFDGAEAERVGKRTYDRARGISAAPRPERALPEGLGPELRELMRRARVEEQRILETIDQSALPFEEVSSEVEALAAEMERIASRAQTVSTFLASHDAGELKLRLAELKANAHADPETTRARERAAGAIEDQLRVGDALKSELQRFRAEMEHLIASLGVVHGQLVRISVSDDPELQEDVAREVRDLRTRVGALADGLRDATAEATDGA
jgi:hypothetical protein